MNIHIGTIIDKMEEALQQLKVEANRGYPVLHKIQEQAIALRSYADLLSTANEAMRSSGQISPRLEQTPSVQQDRVAPIVPKSDGGSLLDF